MHTHILVFYPTDTGRLCKAPSTEGLHYGGFTKPHCRRGFAILDTGADLGGSSKSLAGNDNSLFTKSTYAPQPLPLMQLRITHKMAKVISIMDK